MKALVTGGSGFFGGILIQRLLASGWECVNIDLQEDHARHAILTSIQGDIADEALVARVFAEHRFDAVLHCAAMLAHAVKDHARLWKSNADGTRVVADAAIKAGVQPFVFTSTNCLWGRPLRRPVREDDAPEPVEIYGRSKLEGEKILLERAEKLHAVIIRCPTIVASGRLGLLAILFEFMDEARTVWVVGGGKNRYQFIYANDLAEACIRAARYGKTDVFNIGSDDVPTFRDCYQSVIKRAGTGARVAAIPRWLILPAMRLCYALGLSPLGPYQYKMIAEDFVFDTSKIKEKLDWKPTLRNDEMLWESYASYRKERVNLRQGNDVPAHRQPAKMGIIRLLKWLS